MLFLAWPVGSSAVLCEMKEFLDLTHVVSSFRLPTALERGW